MIRLLEKILMSRGTALCFLVVVVALCAIHARGQDVLITEFQAFNNTTLADKDGQYPDWFELYNAGTSAVDLSGWFVTDDPLDLTRWRVPAVILQPGEFRLIFASGKDLRDPAAELHTNFKLQSNGEYLALVGPDGRTVVWEYGARNQGQPAEYTPFPAQPADFSYGIAMGGSRVRLLESGTAARTLIPANGALGLSWTEPDFDDSGWIAGWTGVGWDKRNDDFVPLIGTDVGDAMYGIAASAYIRIPFTVDDLSIGALVLHMKYDDGFVAYINGTPVASSNAPDAPDWMSSANGTVEDTDAMAFTTFDVGQVGGLLRQGRNILAIHGLNVFDRSVDFLILPELDGFGISDVVNPDNLHFFDQPTPGYGNYSGYVDLAEQPRLSREGGVFSGTLSLQMTVEDAQTQIRYTLDGTEPAESSTRYTGPLSFDRSTVIRARGFRSGFGPSPTISAGYIRLSSNVRDFDSDLPIILLENFGGGRPPTEPKEPAFIAIFEPPTDPETGEVIGRASVRNVPEIAIRIGIEIRGSSTAGRPKPSYMFEAWGEDDDDTDIKPLGMPEESDWILYGPYNFDRALMRNHLIYHLSNEIGRYAVRSAFCEVFFNDGDSRDSLSYSDYMGVYSFMEKIKRGEKRVDVESLPGDALREPAVTGGYMLKVDRPDPGDGGFSTQRQGNIRYVYPKEREIAPAQAAWIRNYLQEFENALFSPDFLSPVYGYQPYVDVDSWTDHHILNVLAMNVDAIRLSGYFYKTRGGKIEYGPIWDFDRSMGSTDSRDDHWDRWEGTGDSSIYFRYDSRYPWWNRLFQDPDVRQRWRDRWHMFRKDQLSTEHIHAVIDGFADELNETRVRNFDQWSNIISSSRWPGEVNVLKNWLRDRAAWIDANWINANFQTVPALQAPMFTREGGLIDPGFTLGITAQRGTIFYTLDGSDPRARGGDIAPGALPYTGMITLSTNVRVVARARESADAWSPPAADTYVVTPTPLVITEIMYHPPDGEPGTPYEDNDYEFVELFNRGDAAIDLSGITLSAGIRFSFAEGTLLFPGQYAVLVRNLDAFGARYAYWQDLVILGEYSGNLQNRGEQLLVLGPLQEPILDFSYRDVWYPTTDGDGFSLCLVDPHDPRDPWNEKQSWQPSEGEFGTPGEDNAGGHGQRGWQRPGDINQDGNYDISDAVGLLQSLFGVASLPIPCAGDSFDSEGNLTLLDLNGDDSVNMADAVWGLSYLFAQGPPSVRGTACIQIQGCPDTCR